MVFFATQAEFVLTNSVLFGGASGLGRLSLRRSPRAAVTRPARVVLHNQRSVQQQQQQPAVPAVGRAFHMAQLAAAALSDPQTDDATFALIISDALVLAQAPHTE